MGDKRRAASPKGGVWWTPGSQKTTARSPARQQAQPRKQAFTPPPPVARSPRGKRRGSSRAWRFDDTLPSAPSPAPAPGSPTAPALQSQINNPGNPSRPLSTTPRAVRTWKPGVGRGGTASPPPSPPPRFANSSPRAGYQPAPTKPAKTWKYDQQAPAAANSNHTAIGQSWGTDPRVPNRVPKRQPAGFTSPPKSWGGRSGSGGASPSLSRARSRSPHNGQGSLAAGYSPPFAPIGTLQPGKNVTLLSPSSAPRPLRPPPGFDPLNPPMPPTSRI